MTIEPFRTFHEIKHVPLRVYNRVVMAYNIMEDFGQEPYLSYIENFDQGEKKQMFTMMMYIKQHGRDAARRFATKDLELEDVPTIN